MNKPQGWDAVQAVEIGEFKGIEPGAYKCVIKKAEVTTSKNGNEMMVILFDVCEGEFANHYSKQYENDKKQQDNFELKWKGIFRQLTTGNSLQYFKGIIKAIESSNTGFQFDFDENMLTGKYFCGVFGREQYQTNDGELKFSTKCLQIRSLEAMQKGIEPLKDKLYKVTSNNAFTTIAESVDDDDLPW